MVACVNEVYWVLPDSTKSKQPSPSASVSIAFDNPSPSASFVLLQIVVATPKDSVEKFVGELNAAVSTTSRLK